ncbi:beta-galactosidase GalA [Pinibacter aurantiacus]|uniref:Glycosyl hydrolase 53 family protein n=1 Tax=Pinibacter aurantiacus TaxID=2851599 RepID=A0A9E2S440_9BACT|nr:beta-galactosidase GalA [Pinibacter aurantiacus]MBV4355506.1 glycosyl hydrolase 53 family protein [Pinibacter aurantiacus]
MRKNKLIGLSLCLALAGLQAGAQKKINIDEDWKFHFGSASDPGKDFNYGLTALYSKNGGAKKTAINPSFVDSSWRTLNLPHDWAVELPFAYHPDTNLESHGYKPVGGFFPETSIGWYRKRFNVNVADSGGRYTLRFDGIFRNANIWVNGYFVGNNVSGYVGAAYDVTDIINFHGENVIVVRVDATQSEGWFYEGAGIYRHVWLEQTNNVRIPDGGLFVYANVQSNAATVNVETTVENKNMSSSNCSVSTYITTREGKIVAQAKEQSLAIATNGKQSIKQQIKVSNPRLWDLDDPYLYRVVSEVRQGKQVLYKKTERFGIRTIRFDAAEGFFLNGKHLKIQGTNNHQDAAGVGSAVPDDLAYYRIRLLKNMGCNAYRTSHHAPAPELLEACDSLGMLVLDEQRLLSSSDEYVNQFERLILRDRNHPSVFLWSIGNEEGFIQTTTVGKRIAETLIAKQKELDPSRTSTYAADLPNVYKGVNEVIPVRGFNYREYAVGDYHKDHPNQPVLGTEMGSTVTTRGIYKKDSVWGYLPDHDLTAPWWASTAEAWWKPAAENNYWQGGFIWTGFDYRGEPTPFSWPNISSHFGVMDMCGFPKNLYYYYQSWWTDKDVLNISPHWNWPGKRGQNIDVWVNSNADNVELFLNGKSLGKKDMPRNSHLVWTVKYEPGKVEAIAYKKSKKLTAKVETTSAPAEILLTPYRTTMLANGTDVSVMNVSIVDKEGREVPDAANMINFTISGPGKIIGVGNGDPSCHEPDICADGRWQRSAFNGKCQVLVQSTKTPGMIKIEASAGGLYSGSTDVVTVTSESVAEVSFDKKYSLQGEAAKPRETGKMIGADISFLPELENRGVKFSDNGVEKDAIQILKDHGFNYIRLRVFNDPARDSGYSPGKGFCDLQHTLQMAKRIKAAGMKFLLDFHYSDYWADPGKQYKPAAWKNMSFDQMKQSLYDFTKEVITALKQQGTTPDMVQIGNEINHGMVWPEGSIASVNNLAQLISAGTAAVKSVDPNIEIMLHVALGGQNEETVFFIDNMVARNVHFDVIGLSYYPQWHGTLDDLRDNMNDLVRRYNKDIVVVEYSAKKQEVHKLVFDLPNGKGKGAFIWEPLSTWESIFDKSGKSNDLLKLYDGISAEYLK